MPNFPLGSFAKTLEDLYTWHHQFYLKSKSALVTNLLMLEVHAHVAIKPIRTELAPNR